jgi:transposase-like protein
MLYFLYDLQKQRTSLYDIGCALYLYFLGVSTTRRVVANKAPSFLNNVKRSHVSIWKWIQKHQPKIMTLKKKENLSIHRCDETIIRVGSELIWLGVAMIESENKQANSRTKYIRRERNMFVVAKKDSCQN